MSLRRGSARAPRDCGQTCSVLTPCSNADVDGSPLTETVQPV